MENMELNKVVTNDTIEEATEVLTSSKNGVKTELLVFGGAMIAGAVLWDRVVKPVGGKIFAKIAQKREESAQKKYCLTKTEDMEDIEIPDIE